MSSQGRLIVILTLALALCACLGALSATISGALASNPGASSARALAITPSTAGNELTARQGASTLLSKLTLPSGAASSRLEPQGDGGVLDAPQTTPGTTAVVDVHAWWTFPGSQQAVLSYVRAHPPAGATVKSLESWVIELTWPPVSGVLGTRQLIVEAVTLNGGGIGIRADAQDVYILTRPAGERVPAGAHNVEIVSLNPASSGAPLVSMHVTPSDQVRSIVNLFDSLARDQQAGPIVCVPNLATTASPNGTVVVIRSVPTVTVTFRPFPGGPAIAQASFADEGPSATGAGGCNAIAFSIRGRVQDPLAGDVLEPMQKLLGVNLASGARIAPPGPPTTASNRLIAMRDVHALLSDVRLPPDATRSPVEPRGDGGLLKSRRLDFAWSAQDDAHAWWVCPCAESAALGYLTAHPPRGSKKVADSFSSGPAGSSTSDLFSWPAIAGVLGKREVWVTATSLANGETGLLAEADSVWIVTRPAKEQIPAGVNEVKVMSAPAGQGPPVWLTVTEPAKVRRIVSLFDWVWLV